MSEQVDRKEDMLCVGNSERTSKVGHLCISFRILLFVVASSIKGNRTFEKSRD